MSGLLNPADWTTREVSGKVLLKTTFYSGPDLTNMSNEVNKITVPNPIESASTETTMAKVLVLPQDKVESYEPVFPLSKFSSFKKASAVYG